MSQRVGVEGKWALVTGASSGFGVEFATLLAEQRANLILVARRREPMEELAERLRRKDGVQIVVFAMDLSTPDAATALKGRTDAQDLAVDVLINNAGYGLYGDFVAQPLARVMNMLRLNILSLTELTHLYACDMAQRGSGHILLTASLLGFQGVPGYAAYAASKAFVLHFGEALHAELGPRGVAVTVLAPGAATTSFGDVAGQTDKGTLQKLMMSPRAVAEIGMRALLRRRSSVVAGWRNGFIVFLNRFTPRALQRRIFQRVMAGEV
ncbi:MAG TPA: SDR family oxidoreductase [Gemmatimonadales bacterium]|nr:SDR family oxidoreductase [Gemmatimonadales bacterium]